MNALLAAAAVVAFAWQGSLWDFAGELTHDYDGPVEGIVRFLREHAREGDVVAMVHGDLPVKFYTGLRVVGGLTGEDLSDVERARFIALRGHIVAPVSRTVCRRTSTTPIIGSRRARRSRRSPAAPCCCRWGGSIR